MPDYKCECNNEVTNKNNVTIKYIDGHGIIHDIKCDDCGKYMKLANPKVGVAGFSSNKWGQVR